MSTKLQQAFKNPKDISIVEFARKLRNADYSKWEDKQRIPEGLARVDLDTRPVGRLGAIFKNYDYSQGLDKDVKNPGTGLYRHIDDSDSVESFMSKKRSRYESFYKIIMENELYQ